MIARDRKDFLWLLAASLLILLWSSSPTWAGYQAETKERHFRGIYYDSQDYAAHIAMMEAGRHGEWAYQFRFTTESFEPAYVRIFYVVLGHFSKWLGLTSEITFHFARWLLGFAALFALYRLMRQIFVDLFWARVAFVLSALGSGLGWLQLMFHLTSSQITPIDFWLIDSYVFFSLSVFPHFAFITAAMCIALSLWLNDLKHPRLLNILWVAVIVILVQFTNPIAFAAIDVGFLGGVLFTWWKARRFCKQHIFALGLLAIVQIPLFVYNVLVLRGDVLWRQYTAQHQTLSPSPDYYLWGFGLFWPFVIWGMIRAFHQRSPDQGVAIFWTLAGFSLAYAPLYTQQRFLQNITIPLAILATYGLIALFESKAFCGTTLKPWNKSLVILLVILTTLSSIFLSLGRVLYLQTYPENFYYPATLDRAVNWLRENASYDDFVLASEDTSQVLAQKAGVRVYFGHEMETLDYRTKQDYVQTFFQGRLPELASHPIKWVVYGPYERALNPSFKPAENLTLVYDNSDVQIYQVK